MTKEELQKAIGEMSHDQKFNLVHDVTFFRRNPATLKDPIAMGLMAYMKIIFQDCLVELGMDGALRFSFNEGLKLVFPEKSAKLSDKSDETKTPETIVQLISYDQHHGLYATAIQDKDEIEEEFKTAKMLADLEEDENNSIDDFLIQKGIHRLDAMAVYLDID